MEITGFEANFLLYALDAYCKTDNYGKVKVVDYKDGLSGAAVQALRDRLFAAHEHPDEED